MKNDPGTGNFTDPINSSRTKVEQTDNAGTTNSCKISLDDNNSMVDVSHLVIEWIELHHYLDLIFQSFEPFSTQVLNAQEPMSSDELLILWEPVNSRVEELMEWAGTIQWIGAPYQISQDDYTSGEIWAFDLASGCRDINRIINDQMKHHRLAIRRNILLKLLFSVPKKPIPVWWDNLIDHTRHYRHIITKYLHETDRQVHRMAHSTSFEKEMDRSR